MLIFKYSDKKVQRHRTPRCAKINSLWNPLLKVLSFEKRCRTSELFMMILTISALIIIELRISFHYECVSAVMMGLIFLGDAIKHI